LFDEAAFHGRRNAACLKENGDVCGENNFGDHSDWWFYDVHPALLLFPVRHHPSGKTPLLPKTLQNQTIGIHGENQKGIKEREH
jgi:hypothetical protein